MKNPVTILILLSFAALFSCEKNGQDGYFNPKLKIGPNLEYSVNDFELYDSSTHILYFKTPHPELIDQSLSDFSIYADTTIFFEGKYWPGYSSSFPTGIFIWKYPFFYPDYVIRFEFMGQDNDPRNDHRLMSAFAAHNLLHSGLSGEIIKIEINGALLTFSFKVTNKDQSDLLILDPEKMGQKLFHYFTNAPVFYNIAQNRLFEYDFEHEAPPDLNAWSLNWMTGLKPEESKIFTFTYTAAIPFPSGDYKASFEFPGLSRQISRDQLYQDNKRIWLGDITMTKSLRIQ